MICSFMSGSGGTGGRTMINCAHERCTLWVERTVTEHDIRGNETTTKTVGRSVAFIASLGGGSWMIKCD